MGLLIFGFYIADYSWQVNAFFKAKPMDLRFQLRSQISLSQNLHLPVRVSIGQS